MTTVPISDLEELVDLTRSPSCEISMDDIEVCLNPATWRVTLYCTSDHLRMLLTCDDHVGLFDLKPNQRLICGKHETLIRIKHKERL